MNTLRVVAAILRSVHRLVPLAWKRTRALAAAAAMPAGNPEACKDYWFKEVDAEGYAVCECGARAVDHRHDFSGMA